ncbi:hypothetical protein [Wolbachia endosymbiont of Ctenocephalides felis wCfeT]|uniref:hypothetical protein n=1 Tax=Wolbachia endosymbiont of Ctenocephalides felis wCfeT TaxID=2732593 RepID=UPI00144624BA|nr:hypothetical protein [Wolbachia endosymbiont of Ctenocephalides felis wCfeT]
MKDKFSGSDDSNSNSFFYGKLRAEDLLAAEKRREAKRIIEKLKRKAAEQKYEAVNEEVSSNFEELLSDIASYFEDDQSGENEAEILKALHKLFESLFNEFGMDINDPHISFAFKEKKNKKNLIEMTISLLKKLLKKFAEFFTNPNLTLDQELDKEIKELEEKIGSGLLSEKDEMEAIKRLALLRQVKMKLGLFLAGLAFSVCVSVLASEIDSIIIESNRTVDNLYEKIKEVLAPEKVSENVKEKAEEINGKFQQQRDNQMESVQAPQKPVTLIPMLIPIVTVEEKLITPIRFDLTEILKNTAIITEIDPKTVQKEEKPKQAEPAQAKPVAEPPKPQEVKPVQNASSTSKPFRNERSLNKVNVCAKEEVPAAEQKIEDLCAKFAQGLLHSGSKSNVEVSSKIEKADVQPVSNQRNHAMS